MPSLSQNLVALVVAVVLLGAVAWRGAAGAGSGISAGFWFEQVTYEDSEAMVDRLGGPVTRDEVARMAALARREIETAFLGLPLTVTDSRDARYRVRVVQEIRNVRAPKYPGPAGESRAVPGFGGQGAVNFRAMVSSAVAHAPAGATRAAIVDAIGRGIGRTAVHEFAHQLLGSAPVDASEDRSSYEFRSADRPEHFYGALHWTHAWPRLQRRLGIEPAG